MNTLADTSSSRAPWNKGRLTGQKPPLSQGNLGDPSAPAALV